MKAFVINSGSSSIKYQLFDMTKQQLLCKGQVDSIGQSPASIKHSYKKGEEQIIVEQEQLIEDHGIGLTLIMELLTHDKHAIIQHSNEIEVIGHRVVHGGEFFNQPIILDDDAIQKIKSVSHLAPLHNPANLKGIEVATELFPQAKQVAVFDTAFHQTMPEEAYRYAIPNHFYNDEGIRAYGMHGTSHLFITKACTEYLNKPKEETSLISIHLGNGCSMAAVKNGQCIDTTMGFSPLTGLVMGTRSGDIDPSVLLYMSEDLKIPTTEINTILNKQSGLKGLTGTNDLREVLDQYKAGKKEAIIAVELYAYRIKKYIGSYIAALGKQPDAIVFTAGVGENATVIRSLATTNLSHLGLTLDEEQNNKNGKGIAELQTDSSAIKILKIPTNEELEIALQAHELVDTILAQNTIQQH